MKLMYITDDSSGVPYWLASTNSDGYDGSGKTPLEAVCSMVNQMEKEMSL
jgi:hypothetical protein